MKKIILTIVFLFVAWVGAGIYISYVNWPKVEWENGEIAQISNCERKNNNYNSQCSQVICEYELSKSKEIEGFLKLQMISQVNRFATENTPQRSSMLVEVTFENQKEYFSCETEKEKIIALEKTSKIEFNRINDL